MDAFFASIEQRDNPELKGKPVIVGGDPSQRGVVSTCSYEARRYGVHSAMPSSRAYQLCPEGVFIFPRMDAYKSASVKIRNIFFEYTDLVEPLSLDEAFLDVTENKKGERSATRLAIEIKKEIFRKTGLTASAGVSFNKFLAKVASDWNKPDGLTVIPPEKAVEFIEVLPIRKFWGVGEVTEKKMRSLGIFTGNDLRRVERDFLIAMFGKSGSLFYNLAHCQDDRRVNPDRTRKSIGKETTFAEDINDIDTIERILKELTGKVVDWLQKHRLSGRTVTLKVRYHDFKTVTRSHTLPEPTQNEEEIFNETLSLLNQTEAGKKYIRLIGISLSNLK